MTVSVKQRKRKVSRKLLDMVSRKWHEGCQENDTSMSGKAVEKNNNLKRGHDGCHAEIQARKREVSSRALEMSGKDKHTVKQERK